MPPADISRLRLDAQRIAGRAASTPEGLVTHLGAMQAQDYAGALWSIGLRVPGATRADVERAVVDRAIVRTWPMRGTLHFVPAVDARWMLELLAPRIMRGAAGRHRQMELDDAAFRRTRAILGRAMQDEPMLTRAAIYEALELGGVPTTGQRGIHILRHLSMERMLCLGPHAGKQPTFVLFDAWIGDSRRLDRDDALRTLAERYFVSHGPATLRDFVWWTGLTVAEAKVALHLARPALERVATDDDELWMSREPAAADEPDAPAHLLPGFDELLLGYKDRSASLAPRNAGLVVPGGNGVFRSTLVLNGRVCGTWTRSARGAAVALELSPFGRLTAAERRAFTAPAERYARFLGEEVTLRWPN